MTFEWMALNLPKQLCEEFRVALRTGYWASGIPLTESQKATCRDVLFYRDSYTEQPLH